MCCILWFHFKWHYCVSLWTPCIVGCWDVVFSYKFKFAQCQHLDVPVLQLIWFVNILTRFSWFCSFLWCVGHSNWVHGASCRSNIFHFTARNKTANLNITGGYFHGLNNLAYGVDIQHIRWCGVLQVSFEVYSFLLLTFFSTPAVKSDALCFTGWHSLECHFAISLGV